MKKIFGILLLALACVSIYNFVRSVGDKPNQTQSGSAAYNSGRKAGRYGATALLIIVGLRLLFSESDSGTTPVPPKKRAVSGALPPPGDPSLRGGMNTFASNPARLRLEFMKWIGARPGLLVLGAVVICFGLWLTFFVHPVPGACVLVAVVIAGFQTVREMKSKFWMGDVCPGIVISENPGLVAVFTDLAAAGGFRPAIRIVPQPVRKIAASAGTRVATVALYRGPVRDGAWADFFPELIALGVSDPAEEQRVLDSISAEEWQDLDDRLSQIANPRPGLYRMWGDHVGTASRPSTSLLTSKITLIALGVLVAFIVFVFSLNAYFNRSREHRMARDSRPFTHSQNITPPRNGTIMALPEQSTPPPSAPVEPVRSGPALTSVELNSRLVTITNLSGRVYENIRLVRADYGGVLYLSDDGGGRIPLPALAIEVLADIGVPTNWPGVNGAFRTMPPQSARPTGFNIGSRVGLEWAGRWETGTIIGKNGPSVSVRMDNPRYRIPLWFGTNQLRLQ